MKIVTWADESHSALSNDRLLGKHAQKHGPPQIRLDKDPFRALSGIVVGQQLSGKAAKSIFSKLETLIGQTCPRAILNSSHERLREAGLSNAKANTLVALAESAGNGLCFKKISKMTDDEIRTELTKIKGIGPWSAEMFLMFTLGRPDVLSVGDLGLRKGLMKVHRLKEMPESKACGALFERWRPWRTAAAWYLWRTLED